MDQAEKSEFGAFVTDVMAYYRQDATSFVLDVWWAACQPFAMEQVRAAVQQHIMDPDHGRFAPKVADLVRVLHGTSTDRAAVAWGVVMREMAATGAYQDIDFGDPATHAAVRDLGGWPKVCRTDMRELGHLQHRFTEAYRAYTARGVAECPMVLMGDRDPDEVYLRAGLPAPVPRAAGLEPCASVMARTGGAGRLLSSRVVQALR